MRATAWLAIAPTALLAALALARPFSLLGFGEGPAALAALDVFEHGNWILPLERGMRGAPIPPLLAWLQAGAGLAVGLGAFALRLPTVLAALAAAWVAWAMAAERIGPKAGVPAAWMLAACPLWLTWLGSVGPDMALSFAVNLALLGLLRAVQHGRGGACFHLGLAAGFLCKGPIAALLIAVACAVAACTPAGRRGLAVLTRSRWSAVLLMPLLWGGLAYAVGESIFLDDALGVFAGTVRGTAPAAPDASGTALVSLLAGGAPFVWLGLLGAGLGLARSGPARLPSAVLAAWLVIVSLSGGQRPVYVLPLLPLGCVLAAHLLEWIATGAQAARRLRAAACLGAAGLVAFHGVRLATAPDPEAPLRALAREVRVAREAGAVVALYGPVPDAFRFHARMNVPPRTDPELVWFLARARPGRPALLVVPQGHEAAARRVAREPLAHWAPEAAGDDVGLAVLALRRN